jgi:hypothetical protein
VQRTTAGENLPLASDAYDPSHLPADDILILSAPYLFGFSLADKQWCEWLLDMMDPVISYHTSLV